MTTQTDGSGNIYADIANVRVTYVPAKNRSQASNWAGSDVLRVQSYREPPSKALHPGAEFPVASPSDFGDFVAAICQVYAEGHQQA